MSAFIITMKYYDSYGCTIGEKIAAVDIMQVHVCNGEMYKEKVQGEMQTLGRSNLLAMQ
jgi:hypothetical protein